MSRPSQIDEQRDKLLPVVARAFGELGYRRATTAELARRCGVRENILYRLWKDKKSMFIAAIEHVYDNAASIWEARLARARGGSSASAALALLEYEASHLGEFGYYRIIFAGLNEVDDEEIRSAMSRTYRRFFEFILAVIGGRKRTGGAAGSRPSNELAAWALIGLGTLLTIGKELGLMTPRLRSRLLKDVGRHLLEGASGEAGGR
jgi:AcrR family transcriptional regulator